MISQLSDGRTDGRTLATIGLEELQASSGALPRRWFAEGDGGVLEQDAARLAPAPVSGGVDFLGHSLSGPRDQPQAGQTGRQHAAESR